MRTFRIAGRRERARRAGLMVKLVGTAAVLRDCVEHVDERPAKRLASLLSDIQVHSSRLADLDDYLRRYQRLDIKRAGLGRNIDEYTASAVAVAAEAHSFFDFARLKTDVAPPPLAFATVEGAFRACGLEPCSDVGSWNVLTNRFPQTVPPSYSLSAGDALHRRPRSQ
jgi:hypothetical protein